MTDTPLTDAELIAEARNRVIGGGEWPALRRAHLEQLIALASRALPPPSEEVAEIIGHLASLGVGACSCGIKSPDTQYHAPRCVYRIVTDAVSLIERLASRAVEAERMLAEADAALVIQIIHRPPSAAFDFQQWTQQAFDRHAARQRQGEGKK